MQGLFSGIPLTLVVCIAGLYGLIIGSFLNVFIYRFHTGKSLSGKSHCLSCGTPLRPYDLIPLLSYLLLRGRCRKCGSYIPARYFLVEAVTGVLFMLSAYTAHTKVELLLLLLAVSVMVVIVVYDIRHFIIPDALTITLTTIALAGLGIDVWQHKNLEHFGMTIGAALAGVLMFYFLWAISKGRWIGFGDVKLMFPLGLLVGPTFVFSLIVYSFWIGAVISLALVGLGKLKRGKLRLHLPIHNLTIKSVVPFAPFLIASCLLILFTHVDVLSLFTFVY